METYNPNQAPLQSGLHEMSVTQKRTLARIQLCAAHFNKQLEYLCVDHDVVCCNKCLSNVVVIHAVSSKDSVNSCDWLRLSESRLG
jgi:hypothetical protein